MYVCTHVLPFTAGSLGRVLAQVAATFLTPVLSIICIVVRCGCCTTHVTLIGLCHPCDQLKRLMISQIDALFFTPPQM